MKSRLPIPVREVPRIFSLLTSNKNLFPFVNSPYIRIHEDLCIEEDLLL